MIESIESLLSSLEDPVTIMDENYVIRYVNRAYREKFESPGQELIGSHVSENVAPGLREIFETNLETALREGSSRQTVTYKNEDGGPVQYELVHRRLSLPGETGGLILSVSHDRTEVFQAEQKVKLFENLVSSSSDMVCVVNEDFVYEVANRPYLEVLGKPYAEVINKPVSEVMDREAFELNFKPQLEAAFRDEPARTLVERLWVDSGPKVVDVVYHKFPHPLGKGSCVACIGRDISDMKLVEIELQEARLELEKGQKLYQRAERLGKLGYWEWNEVENCLSSCSSQYAELFGMSREEMMELASTYEGDISMVHPDDVEFRLGKDLEIRSQSDQADSVMEYRILTRQGKVRHVIQRSSIELDSHNKVVRSFGTLQDITDKKRDEVELARYRAHLEKLVEERTEELESAQAELVRQERLAALGTIMASVSHELRNPLGTVNSSVYLLRDQLQKGKGDIDRVLDRIDRNVERCNRIIGELLDYTREPIADFTKENIDNWIENAIADMDIPTDIDLTLDLNSGRVLELESERIHQCLHNIIKNACDAVSELGPEKTRRLFVKSRMLDDGVEITIGDNGAGMTKEQLKNMFDPFFSTKNFGTGLGLAIVKKIIEQHSGSISVKSVPDAGSEFSLWLPIRRTARIADIIDPAGTDVITSEK